MTPMFDYRARGEEGKLATVKDLKTDVSSVSPSIYTDEGLKRRSLNLEPVKSHNI